MESLVPPVLWKTYNQILLALKAGCPAPLLDPQAGKPDVGPRTFTAVLTLFGVLIQSVGHPPSKCSI